MTRFSGFTDDELDMMEEAFCNEGLKYFVLDMMEFCNEGLKHLVFEIRKERSSRMSIEAESEDKE